MRAKKIDANQTEIVDALRAMGASVQSLASVGAGCPDLVAGWRGQNVLMEVKQGAETFTPAQVGWHRDWKGRAHVVRTVAEAIEVLRAYG